MKKILVILTGGTIGSKVEDNVIDVSSKSPYLLLQKYEEIYHEGEIFEVIKPLNLLSENMTPERLLELLKVVEKVSFDKYQGIIITHGSDTLSYTAAFAGLLFGHVPIPIILIASNYPLGQKGSNGFCNFTKAVSFIRQKEIKKGVYVIYQDNKGKSRVYLATRIREADSFLDQFGDFSGNAYGVMEERLLQTKGDYQPSIEMLENHADKGLKVPDRLDKKVLFIRPYPGLDYRQFQITEDTVAVLHYLYHSATACTKEEHYNFLSFAKNCKKQGVDVYAASYKNVEGKQYATADALIKAGVIPMLNISPEAAYAKLLLLYNQNVSVTVEDIAKNFYFESIENQKK